MTAADHACALVMSWSSVYTRRLPFLTAEARRAELASDLWEHRTAARRAQAADLAVAAAILRRMLGGIPADLSWRHHQLTLASAHPATAAGKETAMADGAPRQSRASRLLHTRRCLACGQRYRRALPNCPVCKTPRGGDGIERKPSPWAAPGGFGMEGSAGSM